jgi:hypothetical protein
MCPRLCHEWDCRCNALRGDPARLVSRLLSFRSPNVDRERTAAPRARLPSSLSLPSACRAFPPDRARLLGLVSGRVLDRLCERESERQESDVLFGMLEKLRIVDVLVDRARTAVAFVIGRGRVRRTVLVGSSIPLWTLPDVGRERGPAPWAGTPSSFGLPSARRAFRHEQTQLVGLGSSRAVALVPGSESERRNSHMLRGPERDRVSAVAAADHPVGRSLSAVRASPPTHPHASYRR